MPNITAIIGQKKTDWNSVVEHTKIMSNIRFNENCIKENAIDKLFANSELVDVLERLSKV